MSRGDNKGPDNVAEYGDDLSMPTSENPTEKAYYKAFKVRLVALRNSGGWSQPEFARLLDIPLERYKKYETRSKFPLHLLPRLWELTKRDTDMHFIVTGTPAPPRRSVVELRRSAAS